ncbi:ATP-binding protein [Rhodoferax ferrireducens]|uniref:ATP-binding protein n=1 Tax=Rhodoferax ferrireducens TaxID=192843 RepID=UPI000E0D83DB|nr:ATP-binding protein [Rhodoferax ferrireducens]
MILKRIQTILEQTPDQKAKDIANHLRADKTEINRVLHDYPDIFVKDADAFTWSLAVLRIDLGSNRWLTAQSFEESLLAAGSPLDSTCIRVMFVVGERCSILLEALARLLAICNQLVDAGKSVSIDFRPSQGTLTYFDRIGFINLLRDKVKILPKRPRISAASTYEGNNYGVVELKEIDAGSPDDNIPVLLGKGFVSCTGAKYDIAAHTVISELYGNVKEHSGTTSAGFAGLQNYAGGKSRHIQTVISDGGRGIVGTLMPILKRKYPEVAAKISNSSLDQRVALLQEVFSAGGLSRVNDPGRGLGLCGSRDYARKYNGVISVRQETLELQIRHDGESVQFSHTLNLSRIAGTHICFDFFLD